MAVRIWELNVWLQEKSPIQQTMEHLRRSIHPIHCFRRRQTAWHVPPRVIRWTHDPAMATSRCVGLDQPVVLVGLGTVSVFFTCCFHVPPGSCS